jgi:hypothetical protein
MLDHDPRIVTEQRPHRPEWVREEYERIGREREAAGRAADRVYRRELFRVCAEMIAWTVAGCVLAAWAFHVTDRDIGMAFFYGGMIVNIGGVMFSCARAYHRGVERGDW